MITHNNGRCAEFGMNIVGVFDRAGDAPKLEHLLGPELHASINPGARCFTKKTSKNGPKAGGCDIKKRHEHDPQGAKYACLFWA